jgi:hypothetical protein
LAAGSGKGHNLHKNITPRKATRKQGLRFEQLLLEQARTGIRYRSEDSEATANFHHDCQALIKGWILA